MTPDRFAEFTQRLVAWAEADPRVVGLAVAGSAARRGREPDEWSDHDLWVITRPGDAEPLRRSTDWLPDAERIVLAFPETVHGVKFVYDDGHLVEAAVFGSDELAVAVSNDIRVLVDKGGIADAVAATTVDTPAFGEAHHAGEFLSNLLVGAGRWRRGERQSARSFVRHHAVRQLITLVRGLVDPAVETLDSLDPDRRVEQAYPAFGARLDAAMAAPTPEAGRRLLGLALEMVPGVWERRADAVAVVRRALEAAAREATRLHHVQLQIPPGGEAAARAFYGTVLGWDEIAKPAELAKRGGCWFSSSWLEVHLGVMEPFAPSTKGHPGIMVGDLDGLADRLDAAGHDVQRDPWFPKHRRFYVADPFGNRLEFLEPETDGPVRPDAGPR